MRLRFLSALAAILMPVVANAALPFVGAYKTIDDESGKPKSIVVLYEYRQGKGTGLAGRIVALFDEEGNLSETIKNPERVADKVEGKPKMVGMDILWRMSWDADKERYEGGRILDPKSGKHYASVIWQDTPEILNVRGKVGPIGRTQHWEPMVSEMLPEEIRSLDTSSWKPVEINVKKKK